MSLLQAILAEDGFSYNQSKEPQTKEKDGEANGGTPAIPFHRSFHVVLFRIVIHNHPYLN
jgi:hypothetical protein